MNHREVVSKLKEYGYYILSEYAEIMYSYRPVGELEIVGMNFILDVKTTSFRNSSNRTIDFLHRHKLLPEDYKYIVYSPLFTEDEIKELKEIYTHPSYIFINNLEKIKEHVSPVRNIECNTTRDLANLLWITDDEMNMINKIYIPYDVYKKHYETITRLRDVPRGMPENNTILLTGRINKIDSLIKENKIVFDKSGLDYVYPFSSGDKYVNYQLKLKSLDKIVLNQAYYKSYFKTEDRHYMSYTSVNRA